MADGFFGAAPEADDVADPSPDLQIEWALLAALIGSKRGRKLEWLPDNFEARHFRHPGHAEIFEALQAVAATGAETPLLHVCRVVERQGIPQSVVHRLMNWMQGTSEADVKGYGQEVVDAAHRRMVHDIAAETARAANGAGLDPVSVDALIAEARARLDAVEALRQGEQDTVTLEEAMDGAIEAGQYAAQNEGMSGVPTGFPSLDALIGGMKPERVYLLGGRPGMAKSAIGGVQIPLRSSRMMQAEDAKREAKGEKKRGAAVGIFSLEMDAEQIGGRALSIGSLVSLVDISNGGFTKETAWADKVVGARHRYAPLPVLIDTRGRLTVEQIRRRALAWRRMLRARGDDLRVVVIDHFHILGEPAGHRGSEAEAHTKNSAAIKALAKEMKIPVLVLCQLNREVEKREDKRPELPDLRGSGSLEQDADLVGFLYRESYYLKKPPVQGENESAESFTNRTEEWERRVEAAQGKASIIVAKHRQGPTGLIDMGFHEETVRWMDPQEGRAAA